MADYYVPMPIETISEEEEQPSKTYRLDLDAGRIVGMVDGQEAVQQAIRKALITARYKCLIYDNQYGSEIEDSIIRKDASRAYIQSAMEGFVRDALKPDTRVLDVHDFSVIFEQDTAQISFSVDTIFGEVEIEEVI